MLKILVDFFFLINSIHTEPIFMFFYLNLAAEKYYYSHSPENTVIMNTSETTVEMIQMN